MPYGRLRAWTPSQQLKPAEVSAEFDNIWANIQKQIDLPVYANNAAALSGGLEAGDLYRTGGDPDIVCVVH